MINELNRNSIVYCVNKEYSDNLFKKGYDFERMYDNVLQLFMDIKRLYQNYNDPDLIYGVYNFFMNTSPIEDDDLSLLNECFIFVENSLSNKSYLELFTIFKLRLVLFILRGIDNLEDNDRIEVYKFIFGNSEFINALNYIYEKGILSEGQIQTYMRKILEAAYTICKEYIYLFKYNKDVFYKRFRLFFKHLSESKNYNDVNKALTLFINKIYVGDYMLLFLLLNNVNNPNWYVEPILLSNFLNLLLYKLNKYYNKNISLIDILDAYYYSDLNAHSVSATFLGLLITIFEKFNMKNLYNAFYNVINVLSKDGVFRYRSLYVSNCISEFECMFPSICLYKNDANNGFNMIVYSNMYYGFEFLAYVCKDLCDNLRKYDISGINNGYENICDQIGFVFDFCMTLILNNNYYKKFCEIYKKIVDTFSFFTIELEDDLENMIENCIKSNNCDYSVIYIGPVKCFIDNVVKVYLEFEKLSNKNYTYNILSFLNCYSFVRSKKNYDRLKSFISPIYSGEGNSLSEYCLFNIKPIVKKYDIEYVKKFLNNIVEYLSSVSVCLPTFDYTYMIFITTKNSDYIKRILNRIDECKHILKIYDYYEFDYKGSSDIKANDVLLFIIFVLYRFIFTNISILIKDLNKIKDNIKRYMSLVFSDALVKDYIYEGFDVYIDIIELFNKKCNEIFMLDDSVYLNIINNRISNIFSKYNIEKYNVESLVSATLFNSESNEIEKIICNINFLT